METIGARVAHMEGEQAERECNDVLVQKEERYKHIYDKKYTRDLVTLSKGEGRNGGAKLQLLGFATCSYRHLIIIYS